MSDTNHTTIPAFDDNNYLADEVAPGAEMLVEGERQTVSEVKRRAITFEDGPQVRFVTADYDALEVIVDDE